MSEINPKQVLEGVMETIREQLPGLDTEQNLKLEYQIGSLLREITDDSAADQQVTIMMSDIRGFTAMTEQMNAVSVVQMLNRYFTAMNGIIYDHGGIIDKYMGDGIMAVFGARDKNGDDALSAVACAVAMQCAMDEVNRENEEHGLPPLFMGIGINSGQVASGGVGSDLHREYTVIGDGVNSAARIESHSLRGQILISEATYARVVDSVEVGQPSSARVKGKEKPMTFYEVLSCSHGQYVEVPRRNVRHSPRVEAQFPFQFQCLDGKSVIPDAHRATTADIGYNGMYVLADIELPQHAEIILTMSLSLLGDEVREVYARVLSVKAVEKGYGIGLEFTGMDEASRLALKDFVDQLVQRR